MTDAPTITVKCEKCGGRGGPRVQYADGSTPYETTLPPCPKCHGRGCVVQTSAFTSELVALIEAVVGGDPIGWVD